MASTTVKIPNLGASLDDVGTALGTTSSPTLIPEYMTATTVTGSPAAGKFYSAISGRAPMIDSSKKPDGKLGVERIDGVKATLIVGEIGSSGEPVYEIFGDSRVRLIGDPNLVNNSLGFHFENSNPIEVTFYGTGINFIANLSSTLTGTYSVDGGSPVAFDFSGGSGVIEQRDYPAHIVLPIASGLTQGVHTVTIAPGLVAYYSGIEILNESLTIGIPEGSITADGVTQTIATPTTTDLTTFDVATQDGSGVITDATKGGCVVVYIDTDGTVKKSINYADTTQLDLTAADHSNETVVQKFNWREFGAGRADDFSTLSSASNRAFTLDDGTTTLVCKQMVVTGSLADAMVHNSSTEFFSITFVGTGLDIAVEDNAVGGSSDWAVLVDNSSIGSLVSAGTGGNHTLSIVSGLPFGTHVVRITQNSTTYNRGFKDFIIYAPSKPALTTGQIELSCGYKTADFVANTVAGLETISQGVIRKSGSRELVYVNGTTGTTDWNVSGVSPNNVGGLELATDRLNSQFSDTFFGTGFEFRTNNNTGFSTNVLLELDDGSGFQTLNTTNFPGLSSSVYGGFSFNAGTGVASWAVSTTIGGGLVVSDLPLANNTIRTDNQTASKTQTIHAMDIITPYYAYKNDILNLSSELVGSNALQSKVLIPGATDKKIIATAGIDAGTNADSEVSVDSFTGSNGGLGSAASNKIGVFVGTRDVKGSDIVYAKDSVNGDTFTIRRAGVYAMTLTAGLVTGDNYQGISVNSNQLTTSILTITPAHRKAITQQATALPASCSVTLIMAAGDVVRTHHASATLRTGAGSGAFRVTQILKF